MGNNGGALTVTVVTVILSIVMFISSASAMLVFINNDVYEVNSDMIVRVVSTTVANVSVTVRADNASSDLVDGFQINITATGATSVTRSQSYLPGQYDMTLQQGTSSTVVKFEIVNEILYADMKLMGGAGPVVIETVNQISTSTDQGGNFTDLLGLNLSENIYYGNYSNLTGDGTTYHFVVVDEQVAGVYDTVYIDDDKDFQVFNDNEDNSSFPFLETSESLEGMVEIDSTHRYIIADMETTTGQKIFLITPRSSATYTSSDTLYMLDLLTHKNDTIVENKTLNITIYDENDVVVNSTIINITEDGYSNTSINLSDYSSGKYVIYANETPVDVFKVETFKLHSKITDLNDNQMSSYSPGSKAKVWAVSRNVAGNLVELDESPSGTLLLPDGTTASLTFTNQSTGVYTAETSALTTTGEYKITVSGDVGTDSESVDIGFGVESVIMEVITLNTKYLDEGTGEGTEVNAFAPGKNVSVAVFLINSSKGSSIKSGGPPCGFDGNSCFRIPCTNAQFDVVVKDDKGKKYELDDTNFSVMTIDAAASLMGIEGPEEAGMGDQCMLMVWGNNTWSSKNGNYKIEISFSNSSIGDLESGSSFSIQRLIAMGSTVDLRGDSFSFFAPNSTVRVKLEIRDMVTDQLLSGSDIISAKITEMWKEWPDRKNALNEMDFNKSQLNESLSGDKITFTSPPEEGFYVANFRFKANISGTLTDGTGMIFFELKKYMIWADLDSQGSDDNWYVKSQESIILSVSVMDIDMGSRFGKEGSSASCTGCEGLIANISSLRNEQFFKEMVDSVDFVVTTGVVANSTSGATINITPIGSGGTYLPSGWYGIDIILSDPDNGDTYYGWGWFEIRNFWVDVFEVEEITEGDDAGNYTAAGGEMKGGDVTVPVGGSVLLGVAAFQPPTPQTPPTALTVTSVEGEGMLDDDVWPPLPISSSKYSFSELSGTKKMIDPWCDDCAPFAIKIINMTVASDIDEGEYLLNLRVTASGAGSDVGNARITVSSYQIDYASIPESKMYDWPPVYATTENLSIMFNATDFDDLPYNITNVTIEEFFNDKTGRPIKFKHGQNYTNNCTGNTSTCVLDVYLTGLSAGMYFADFEITDSNGAEQLVMYEFEVKNLLFSVPKIYEGWSWESSTLEKQLEAWYGEDRCDNRLWLMQDRYQTNTHVVTIELQQGVETNITLPTNKTDNITYGIGAFCINSIEGEWWYTMSPSCSGGATLVYVVNNGTNVWINGSTDMTNTVLRYENDSFILSNLSEMNWTIQPLRISDTGYIRIKHAGGKICGRNDINQSASIPVIITPPNGSANYTSFYHGPNYLAGDLWNNQDYLKETLEIPNRPVYIYHNTTHLWLHKGITNVDFTNGSATSGPFAVDATVNDGYHGKWTLISLSKSKITLKGLNVLENGIYVNTSLSTSGTIKIGELNEQNMGFENKFSNELGGMDLDGDKMKNGSLYFVILDQSNGYNTLIYSDSSEKWNFSDVSKMVNTSETNRSLRQVGNNDTLTLLSIDPRANQVKFYDPSALGDWAELGDARIGDNITIPVVVKTPDGNAVTANVSVPTLKLKTTSGTSFVTTGLSAIEISGIGELTINVSALGLNSGGYEFEVRADSNTYGTEYLNEWMWPRSVVRNFMVDTYAGYGGVTTDFVAVTATKFGGGESGGKVLELTTINGSYANCGNILYQGVAARVREEVPNPWSNPTCTDYDEPDNILEGSNYTYSVGDFDNQYFIYFNENVTYGNQTIWVKQGDCNFSSASNYSISDQMNVTLGSSLFMLYVINISHCNGVGNSPLIVLGVTGLDSSSVEPREIDDWGGNRAPRWSMTSINSSSIIYDVIYANDSGISYPQASTWGLDSPVKAVWLSTNGNFSGTNGNKYRIGDNFTANEYIASLGPDSWSGLLVADDTNLASLLGAGVRPGMDLRVADMQVYFGKINESASGLDIDLNLDDDKDDVFYSVAFDDFEDGNQELMRIYVDDDLNITEPWWADSNNPDSSSQYYDFYGNETNMGEQEGNPPSGMWGGNIRFGPNNDSLSWEQLPSWNLKTYNGTNMILEKNTWQLDNNKTISLTLKVFDFAQNPIQGATVSLISLHRFGGGQPFATLNESQSEFSLVNTQNTTDSNGYAMIKLQPPGEGWLNNAEYIASLRITSGGMTEDVKEWFRIGGNN